ncbi:suppressor of glycerol defect [Coemansia asiatica]|nr:suppressor of glycerol defect [Coemansia asiatica]
MAPKRSRHQANTELPASLASKLANSQASGSQGTDDKRFKKKFKNTAKTRKLARKQARQDKKQRKNEAHHRARGYATTSNGKTKQSQAKNKSNAVGAKEPKVANKSIEDMGSVEKPLKTNSAEDERARLTRFAKRNEGLYQLLRESSLIDNVDKEAGIQLKADEAEELEDREMRRLERNLGIKNNKKLGNAFYEEGLGDLLEGFEFGSRGVRSKDGNNKSVSEDHAKGFVDSGSDNEEEEKEEEEEESSDLEMDADSDSASDLESSKDDLADDLADGSEDDQDEDDMFGLNEFCTDEGSESEDSDIAGMYRSQGIDANPDLEEDEDDDEDDDDDIGEESESEVLLKLIRISGVQLRRDDPLALKEIVHRVTETVTKAGIGSFSVRCQFMVESLTHLKDNRMRNTMSQSADNVARLKRFLGNMDKRRAVASAEPINIGIRDIRDVGSKGKWWLVGASWVGNQYQGEQHNDGIAAREALRKLQNEAGDSEVDRLMQLARQQHMNTDVRRSIFVTLLSSEDYADAFERLLRLDLKKTQVREVVRVVLHCCGQEAAYNPYYTLVAFKLCCYHSSYRLTMQYALWDFLREMGEADVGGLSRVDQGEDDASGVAVPLRRIVNVAKLFAWLVDKQALSLLVLKTVTFASVGKQARIFFQVMFSTIFLQHKKQSDKDAESLLKTFGRATANPAMCHGMLFFFKHFVRNCELVKDEEKPIVKWGCKIAKQAFRAAAGAAGASLHNDVF